VVFLEEVIVEARKEERKKEGKKKEFKVRVVLTVRM
jgi:hypothetical protein